MSNNDESSIKEHMDRLHGWELYGTPEGEGEGEGMGIRREFPFPDFNAGIEFCKAIALEADAAGHHPDLCISYGSVTVELTTHDRGIPTEKDFVMAEKIEELYSKRKIA